MKDFLLRYFLTAAIGATAVYFGIPVLHGMLSVQTTAPSTPVGTTPSLAPTRLRPLAARSPDTPQTADSIPDRKESHPHRPPRQSPADAAHVGTPTHTPGVPEVSDTFWGITIERARAFNRAGQHLRDLPAGTLVTYSQTAGSSAGEVAVCRVLFEERWVEDVLVPLQALLRFEGNLHQVPRETRDLLVRYHALRGQLAAREDALRQAQVDANPHANAYRKAAQAYQTYQRTVEARIAARDAAEGHERSRIANELARMRGEGVQLQTALREADQRYRQWRDANAGTVNIHDDPQVRALQNIIQDLKPRIQDVLDTG